MGWPKGMPRKGHVNKDGQAHAKRGSKLALADTMQNSTKGRSVRSAGTVTMVREDAQYEKPSRRVEASPDGTGEIKKEWKPLLRHPSWSLPADHCPACGFPEADAGYCNACGWSKPTTYGRVA